MSKSRNYCFTLNNFTPNDWDSLTEYKQVDELPGNLRYLVCGREKGEYETPHIQGFLMFVNARSFTAVVKWFQDLLGHSRVHVEAARGSAHEAATYCKKDQDYVELGDKPEETFTEKKATATERAERNLLLVQHGNIAELRRVDPVWFVTNCTKFNLLGTLCRPAPADLTSPCGLLVSGAPGAGKSTFCRNLASKLGFAVYTKPHNKWWDGYMGEPFVLWDELQPAHADFFTGFFKLWTDQYATRVEAKGSTFHIRPRVFAFTSNYSFDDIFGSQSEIDRAALRRRFRYIIPVFSRESLDSYLEYRFD